VACLCQRQPSRRGTARTRSPPSGSCQSGRSLQGSRAVLGEEGSCVKVGEPGRGEGRGAGERSQCEKPESRAQGRGAGQGRGCLRNAVHVGSAPGVRGWPARSGRRHPFAHPPSQPLTSGHGPHHRHQQHDHRWVDAIDQPDGGVAAKRPAAARQPGLGSVNRQGRGRPWLTIAQGKPGLPVHWLAGWRAGWAAHLSWNLGSVASRWRNIDLRLTAGAHVCTAGTAGSGAAGVGSGGPARTRTDRAGIRPEVCCAASHCCSVLPPRRNAVLPVLPHL
jgi:hypothetical protein